MFFLPRNVAPLAKLAAKEGKRWAMNGVRLEELPEGGYKAIATDGKRLAIVTETATESPVSFSVIPAVKSAPNGAMAATVPADDLVAALKAIPKRKRWEKADNRAAVVLSADVTTLATTDGTQTAVSAPRNAEGRFPPYKQVFPEGQPVATIKFDPKLMAEFLKAASDIIGGDEQRVTLEIYAPLQKKYGESAQPMQITGTNGRQEFRGLVMPLT